ncbi:MAG: fructosamine kinase family protein [Pleurocapsa minor HA4230-MV1]|jgi:fructosamine-3-kinase|nr:fructosamine kinase family protein [Pleurocapsa minor HA4230-MV1]
MWTEIAQAISRETEQEFAIANTKSVSGGCINQGYRVSSKDRTYFVKLNDVSKVEMFAAEALGLKQMYATKTITVPQPVCWGTAANSSYLVLQWLDLGSGSNQSWAEMGRQLAAMHRVGTSQDFGWELNNTIGSTPQINTWMDNWADFFAEQRIGYQLKLAKRRGGNFPESNRVVDLVRNKLAEWQPPVSLVHGDLWSGNAAISSDGAPIILDPATYYGDRETDLAMTELFGGFPTAFYQGYNEAWQLDSGYGQRKSIYNLYHVLNHFNLFGGGYANQAQTIIQRLIP